MIGLHERGNYKNPASIQREFENIVNKLRFFLSQTFDVDGRLIQQDPSTALIPVGTILNFAGTTPPTGFLLADGSQVSRAKYSALFSAIGTAFGAGDSATTFNLPDLRGRFVLTKAASGTGSALADTGGAIDHVHEIGGHSHGAGTLATASAGDHNHSASTGADGNHTHSVGATPSSGIAIGTGADNAASINHIHTTGDSGTHSHSVSVNSSGAHTHSISGSTASAAASDSGASNPPYVVLNAIIYTSVA